MYHDPREVAVNADSGKGDEKKRRK